MNSERWVCHSRQEVEGNQMALPLLQRLLRMAWDDTCILMVTEAYRGEILPMTNNEKFRRLSAFHKGVETGPALTMLIGDFPNFLARLTIANRLRMPLHLGPHVPAMGCERYTAN